jgi:hypothetical protein
MYIDDGGHPKFLTAAIEKREQAAGVISVPVRYHDALNGAEGSPESGKVAGEGLGFRTCVEKREAGRCVRSFVCFLVGSRGQISRFQCI